MVQYLPSSILHGRCWKFCLRRVFGRCGNADRLFYLLLPVIGLLFVIEAGSSLTQIVSKKLFKKDFLICADSSSLGGDWLARN